MTDQDDAALDDGGDPEHDKGDPQRPGALVAGLELRIDLVRNVVAVATEEVTQPSTRAMAMVVPTMVAVVAAYGFAMRLLAVVVRAVVVVAHVPVPVLRSSVRADHVSKRTACAVGSRGGHYQRAD